MSKRELGRYAPKMTKTVRFPATRKEMASEECELKYRGYNKIIYKPRTESTKSFYAHVYTCRCCVVYLSRWLA